MTLTLTLTCASAGLALGGGKSVIVLSESAVAVEAARRSEAMRDLVTRWSGSAVTTWVGEDVGTTAEDMLSVRERTSWAFTCPHGRAAADGRRGVRGHPGDRRARLRYRRPGRAAG
ncbi:hypothetical protein [Nonomuraea sp. NPDC050643]|uniref:hypothetical protein n=1 Tax=Nonomuraea sp. NPDC050643 TaxID=3155660 RepID=UPI0033F8F25A